MNRFPGTVVLARDGGLRDAQGAIRPERLSELLDRACCRLGGVGRVKDFWPLLVRPGDVVGVKINCLAGRRLSTTREVVEALVASLARAGVRPASIVVWDRTERELKAAGFTLRSQGAAWRCFGTDRVGYGYEREIAFSGAVGSCLSRILTRTATVLINVGVLKDHDLAGVSVGMKNLYGVLHNPNKYHDNVCDPYVADVANLPVVRKKLRLTIADGTLAQCHAGPAFNPAYAWQYNGLLVGTDPVAVDRAGCDILDERRQAKGLPSFAEARRWPKWLKTAQGYGLGHADSFKLLEEADGRG
jgi:uncharacterized protein (DUF362 family)